MKKSTPATPETTPAPDARADALAAAKSAVEATRRELADLKAEAENIPAEIEAAALSGDRSKGFELRLKQQAITADLIAAEIRYQQAMLSQSEAELADLKRQQLEAGKKAEELDAQMAPLKEARKQVGYELDTFYPRQMLASTKLGECRKKIAALQADLTKAIHAG